MEQKKVYFEILRYDGRCNKAQQHKTSGISPGMQGWLDMKMDPVH
jgi:hypothetical protein